MSDGKIVIELDPVECGLILKYGTPFEDVIKVVEKGIATSRSVRLTTDKYWLELLIGDLSYSANRAKTDAVWEELDALCCRLESECSPVAAYKG